MMMTPEEELENISIDQWFERSFFESNLWYFWSEMRHI